MSRTLIIGAVVAAGLVACSSDKSTTQPVAQTTNVRVVHAINDGPAVDVRVNGTVAISSITFGTFQPSTQGTYAAITPAPLIALAPAGTSTAVFSGTFSQLVANGGSTLVAMGNVTPNVAPADTVIAFADTTASNASAGLVRVINAVDYLTFRAGGDPVDVYVYPTGTARPATPDVANLAWGTRSPYFNEAAGTLTVDVLPAGGTGAAIFTGTLTIANSQVRTLVLIDPPTASGSSTPGSILTLNDR